MLFVSFLHCFVRFETGAEIHMRLLLLVVLWVTARSLGQTVVPLHVSRETPGAVALSQPPGIPGAFPPWRDLPDASCLAGDFRGAGVALPAGNSSQFLGIFFPSSVIPQDARVAHVAVEFVATANASGVPVQLAEVRVVLAGMATQLGWQFVYPDGAHPIPEGVQPLDLPEIFSLLPNTISTDLKAATTIGFQVQVRTDGGPALSGVAGVFVRCLRLRLDLEMPAALGTTGGDPTTTTTTGVTMGASSTGVSATTPRSTVSGGISSSSAPSSLVFVIIGAGIAALVLAAVVVALVVRRGTQSRLATTDSSLSYEFDGVGASQYSKSTDVKEEPVSEGQYHNISTDMPPSAGHYHNLSETAS
jgi:hypothetical protein